MSTIGRPRSPRRRNRDGGRRTVVSIGSLVSSGPLLLAIPVAAAAGAVTFLSPCVLPLVPGYLSYITGMSGASVAGVKCGAAEPGAAQKPGVAQKPSAAEKPSAADTTGDAAE